MAPGKTYYEKLGVFVDFCGKIVENTIQNGRNLLIIGGIYYVFLVILGVVTVINPNITTVVGAFGLTTLGVGAGTQSLRGAYATYITDRGKLRLNVDLLRAHYGLLDPKNADELKKFKEYIIKKFLPLLSESVNAFNKTVEELFPEPEPKPDSG